MAFVNRSTRFAFGANWADYAMQVDETRLATARDAVAKLLGDFELAGRRVLDIGSGSGLHAVAAAQLGAGEVVAIDLDPQSVATTGHVFERFLPDQSRVVEQRDVFDLTPGTYGRFDVVYSWGVLHHTGNLALAVQRAAACVAPGGLLVLGLYRRTRLCPLWRLEKRWYAGATPRAQDRARRLYMAVAALRLRIAGRDWRGHQADYAAGRGMSFLHDLHDWLGGYPYESVRPGQVAAMLAPAGLTLVRSVTEPPCWGLLGSGCDEFVFRREE